MHNTPVEASLFQDLYDLRPQLSSSSSSNEEKKVIAGVVLVTGCWQKPQPPVATDALLKQLANDALVGIHDRQGLQIFSAMISIDDQLLQSDFEFGLQSLKIVSSSSSSSSSTMRTLPSALPALALVYQNRTMESSEWMFLETVSPLDLYRVISMDSYTEQQYRRVLLRPTVKVVNRELLSSTKWLDPKLPFLAPSTALRLFVAGDRSSVGKSSVCLGLLGNWYRNKSSINKDSNLNTCYIKPATQNESKQLIQEYCEEIGMECVPIGPLVYYRGFTRAYLSGQTSDSSVLLEDCARAVDLIARGKDIVLMDGVGFPAVGSICGTSNAQVAQACRAHAILLVGGAGVGGAVDAFNLNATYFAVNSNIPLIGAVFNKLPTSGYYKLEDCREQVTSYFKQYRPQQRAFGFVPVSDSLKYGIANLDEFLQLFDAHVDVAGILEATKEAARQDQHQATASPLAGDQKRRKIIPIQTRQVIERAAINAGAAPSA